MRPNSARRLCAFNKGVNQTTTCANSPHLESHSPAMAADARAAGRPPIQKASPAYHATEAGQSQLGGAEGKGLLGMLGGD